MFSEVLFSEADHETYLKLGFFSTSILTLLHPRFTAAVHGILQYTLQFFPAFERLVSRVLYVSDF